ncbi:MAG: alpha-1,2-fucosyltransferase [Lachnospiraceae bacterium]|nr:alpha-1,2-fucosyltransferase [Lachnospiraceae bacterium]
MKIQFLNGGLANQVFQYIFYRFAELRNPDKGPWFLDDSFFFVHDVHNGYELEKVFGLKPNLLSKYFEPDVWDYIIAQKKESNKSVPQILVENGIDMIMIAETDNYTQWNPFSGQIESIRTNEFTPEITGLPGDIYYHGYWINKYWFDTYKETFLKELSFPEIEEKHNIEYADIIRSTDSVSLHIRRGDFVEAGWELSPEEINELIETMKKEVPDMTLFVFSDDIKWCKENENVLGLKRAKETVYVEGNSKDNSFRDMQLMSMCRNMIIGPSSFNYLAALLNCRLEHAVNITKREI